MWSYRALHGCSCKLGVLFVDVLVKNSSSIWDLCGDQLSHRHKDNSKHEFLYPHIYGPWIYNVRSLCLCGHSGCYYGPLSDSGDVGSWVPTLYRVYNWSVLESRLEVNTKGPCLGRFLGLVVYQ